MRYDVHLYTRHLGDEPFIGKVFYYDLPHSECIYTSDTVEGAEWMTTLRAYIPETFHKQLLHSKDAFRLHIRVMIRINKELIENLMPEIYYSYKMGLYND